VLAFVSCTEDVIVDLFEVGRTIAARELDMAKGRFIGGTRFEEVENLYETEALFGTVEAETDTVIGEIDDEISG
jgi:hypothetical protein